MTGSVVALVGAQYGSEGKGAIAAKIANDFDVHVRTGAPNAGHTYYIDKPEHWAREDAGSPDSPHHRMKVVARSVPVGVCNPQASLVIGAGGIIDLEQLLLEVEALDSLGLNASGRLQVDAKALVIDPLRHRDYEGGIRGHAHEQIGSTGEGVGIARMAHLARGVLVRDFAWGNIDHAGDKDIRYKLESVGIGVTSDTSRILSAWWETGSKILLEGTQGSGLSSVHGPWPYCTSSDTNAAQLLVDAGISPTRLTSVILVARTFPIRVAGNSGPMLQETSWENIGESPEYTTVTKKQRRVGWWDDDLFKKAVRLNGPARVAVTFMDYIDPLVRGVTDWSDLSKECIEWIRKLEWNHDVKVAWVGTGPDSVAVNANVTRWGVGV